MRGPSAASAVRSIAKLDFLALNTHRPLFAEPRMGDDARAREVDVDVDPLQPVGSVVCIVIGLKSQLSSSMFGRRAQCAAEHLRAACELCRTRNPAVIGGHGDTAEPAIACVAEQ